MLKYTTPISIQVGTGTAPLVVSSPVLVTNLHADTSDKWNEYTLPTTTANDGKVLAVNAGATALEWIDAGGAGTVTSISAGNGMSFTSITDFGPVTMGTPSSLNGTTTNAVTANSHTHAISLTAANVGAAATIHNLIDITNHPVTGLTTGHFLKATGATTYGFAAHGLTATDVGAAATSHAHGSITTDGKIGSTTGLMIKTTTAGALSALAAGTTAQFLRGDGTWQTPPPAANLTSILLTLGNYTIGFNSVSNKLEIKYIGV